MQRPGMSVPSSKQQSPPSRYVMRLQPTPERSAAHHRRRLSESDAKPTSSIKKPNLSLRIPKVEHPDAAPIRLSFRDPDSSPEQSPSFEEEKPFHTTAQERKRLADAIEKFYLVHAPHKAHQADAIAKAFGSKRNGVSELWEKLRSIYGAVPQYSTDGGAADDDDDSSDDESTLSSASSVDDDDDDDDSSSDDLSKYDYRRNDSRRVIPKKVCASHAQKTSLLHLVHPLIRVVCRDFFFLRLMPP